MVHEWQDTTKSLLANIVLAKGTTNNNSGFISCKKTEKQMPFPTKYQHILLNTDKIQVQS